MTISTLYYLFKAKRELFKDTWIHDKWEWKEYPVIRINLLEVASSSIERLEKGLRNIVRDNAKDLGVELEEKEDHLYGFTELIKKRARREK